MQRAGHKHRTGCIPLVRKGVELRLPVARDAMRKREIAKEAKNTHTPTLKTIIRPRVTQRRPREARAQHR